MPRSPVTVLAAALALSVAAPAGATDFFTDFTVVSSTQENSCLATTASTNGDDCSYNHSNPSGLGTSQWIGPTFSGGYYAPGAGPAVYTNPVVPNPVIAPAANLPVGGKTGIPVKASVRISDSDTPADPSDDQIALSFHFQAFERNVDLGNGTRALEKFTATIDQVMSAETVNSATPNAAGGLDYVIGNSFPDLLNGSTSANGGFADSFPSEVASQSSIDATDTPYWSAPGAVGIARFEGNVGGSTVVNNISGYSCTTDTGSGPAPCGTTNVNWDTSTRAAFQNVLMKVSTDATGKITSGLIILVKEFQLLPGSGSDSWLALTVPLAAGTIRPIAVVDAVPFNGTNPVTIPVLANDLNLTDTPITVTKVNDPLHGTIVVNANNTITYTPTTTAIRDNFLYRITNGSGQVSENSSVLLGANDVPVTHDDLANLNGLSRVARFNNDYVLGIDFEKNDTGLADVPFTVKTVVQPAHGTAQFDGQSGLFAYTPTQAPGFFGTEHFQYQITDANKDSSISTITVRGFFAVQDHPVAVSGEPHVISVLQNDYGRSDSPVIVGISQAPGHGTATVNADNTVTYTSNPNFAGKWVDDVLGLQCESQLSCGDQFQYTLRNAEGDTAAGTVFVDVNPGTFFAAADVTTAVAGAPLIIDILQNDNIPNGSSVTVEISIPPDHGIATVNPDNTLTYTANQDFAGLFSQTSLGDSFQYALHDTAGDTRKAAVLVNVYPPPSKNSGGSSFDPGTAFGLLAVARLWRRRGRFRVRSGS